jgi:hypothetical protein
VAWLQQPPGGTSRYQNFFSVWDVIGSCMKGRQQLGADCDWMTIGATHNSSFPPVLRHWVKEFTSRSSCWLFEQPHVSCSMQHTH